MDLDSFQNMFTRIQPAPEDMGSRYRPRTDSQLGIHFTARDIKRLFDPTAWLNDVCINDGSRLLFELFAPNNVSLFNSFTLYIAGSKEDSAAEKLKKKASRLDCKTRDVWLIPCFHDSH